MTNQPLDEPKTSLKTPAPIKTPTPPTPATMPAATVPELPTVPTGPKLAANAVYAGSIHVKNDSSTHVPLQFISIRYQVGHDDPKRPERRRGGKFTGVWDAPLRAVTDQVVSAPKGIHWAPEPFTIQLADDGKSATYECVADGKTYVADLTVQSAPVMKVRSIYKGTIRAKGESGSGTPLTINLAADRKSGTMTQTSKSGDTVVRFNGVRDGATLRHD